MVDRNLELPELGKPNHRLLGKHFQRLFSYPVRRCLALWLGGKRDGCRRRVEPTVNLVDDIFLASTIEKSFTATTHVPPLSPMHDDELTDTDHVDSDTGGDGVAGSVRGSRQQTKGTMPTLFHRVKNERSILALVVSDQKIYAGTQGGEILVNSGLHQAKKV